MTDLTITRVLPELETVQLAAPDARDRLAAWYQTDAPVRLNMITSLTGSATGSDGTSNTLTNRADRKILGVIRRQADVVVVGAQSVRTEGYIVPKHARLAVVTTSGDLTGHRLAPVDGAPAPIVLCPASAVARVKENTAAVDVEIIPLPDVGGSALVSPRDAVTALTEQGMSRIVCEGGPALASAFLRAGVIREACVSVSPTLDKAESPFVSVRRAVHSDVVSHAVDSAGFSYLRLAIRP